MSEKDWDGEMRVYVSARGDVDKTNAIDWQTSFGLGVDREMFHGDYRATMRKRLENAFGLIHPGGVSVRFEDECPTCGELLPSCGGPSIIDDCPESWHRGDV